VALEPAVQLALALASPSTAPRPALHLLLVLPPLDADDENMPEALAKEGAKSYLAGVAKRLEADHAGLLVTWTVTAQLDVASAILRVAENGDDTEGAGAFGGCDGIAMATHGYSGLKRWMLGSTTERVLQAAKLPLLIVRPREQPSA
jgi:nucleotide-binding universal stress UspA family protein